MGLEQQSKLKLLWLQSITCNGNTHSFINHHNFISITSKFEITYHPVIESSYDLSDLLSYQIPCDILVIEGSYSKKGFLKGGIEVSKIIKHYANEAKYIITAGTCATFGGIFKQKDPENIEGFCFNGDEKTINYKLFSKKLISIPGCPIHPEWLFYVLSMIEQNKKIALDDFHRPRELYGYTVHNGCLRNEYFEWKIDVKNFGEKEGCLFYEQGCQGPYTHGSCNKILWNNISSKTRVGTPCFGCTEPTFPKEKLFVTKTNMGLPATMPLGIPKRAYFTITGIAKSFKIKRLSQKLLEYDK